MPKARFLDNPVWKPNVHVIMSVFYHEKVLIHVKGFEYQA